jgi:hypothetical protein
MYVSTTSPSSFSAILCAAVAPTAPAPIIVILGMGMSPEFSGYEGLMDDNFYAGFTQAPARAIIMIMKKNYILVIT